MRGDKLVFDIIFVDAHLSLVEASLSMIYMFGCDPERASLLLFLSQAFCMFPAVFEGSSSTNIALLS